VPVPREEEHGLSQGRKNAIHPNAWKIFVYPKGCKECDSFKGVEKCRGPKKVLEMCAQKITSVPSPRKRGLTVENSPNFFPLCGVAFTHPLSNRCKDIYPLRYVARAEASPRCAGLILGPQNKAT
jgi:hypothetical protein